MCDRFTQRRRATDLMTRTNGLLSFSHALNKDMDPIFIQHYTKNRQVGLGIFLEPITQPANHRASQEPRYSTSPLPTAHHSTIAHLSLLASRLPLFFVLSLHALVPGVAAAAAIIIIPSSVTKTEKIHLDSLFKNIQNNKAECT